MKKLLLIFVLAALVFTGCGKSSSSDSKGTEEATQNDSTKCKYTVDGTDIVPGTDFAEAYKALGEPDDYYEAASCYFDGMDKTYYYADFDIITYPKGDKDYVQDICIRTENGETEKGIKVGSTFEEVKEIYGDDYQNTGSMYRYYYDDESYIYFFIMEDAVKYFGYAVDVSNS